ncbi:MAG TPA: amidohydrolase family protein [Ktedonobacterales bacterium]|nr:amidohydrolase family protein [Ktedonobacterales bacterium]
MTREVFAMSPLDLSAIPVVDNHCHGMYRDADHLDIPAWRRLFTEAYGAAAQREHVATTLFYQRLLRALAAFWDCAPDEDAVLAARGRYTGDERIRALLHAANIAALLVDQGYPPRDQVLPDSDVAALAGCRTFPMLRLEPLMERLIAEHPTFADVEDALRAALADVRAQGYVALKSIAAYRTGLDIRVWDRADAEASFAEARRIARETGALRLAQKPLLDTLLHVAFAEAARQELPMQFHTGYGDTDADMLLATPLHLRGVLEQRAYRGMRVVLLHECYPYTRQGGYLAAVYDHVYLDLSYAIPFLGYGELVACTRAAFGVAPYSKLMYSSDAVGLPELLWISARDGRRALGQVLGDIVEAGDLDVATAEIAGAAVLHDNAVRVYDLSS